jgi:predicted transcriptional regulator
MNVNKSVNSFGTFLNKVRQRDTQRPARVGAPIDVLRMIETKAHETEPTDRVPMVELVKDTDIPYLTLFAALQDLEKSGLVNLEGSGDSGVVRVTSTGANLLKLTVDR